MSASRSANEEPLISRNDLGDKIAEGLRLFVGRGRRYSVKQLHSATGVPERLIECAMCDTESTDWRLLKSEHLASLSKFLGTGFTSEWLGLCGQGAFELPDDEATPLAVLVADSTDNAADLAAVAADERLCSRGRNELKQVGQRDIARGVRILAMAGGRAGSMIRRIFERGAHFQPLRKAS